LVSAIGFFAATFGVAVYSDLDIIKSMCSLMARGAVVSMFCVILILPSIIYALDGLIVRTTAGMKAVRNNKKTSGTPDMKVASAH
jgi:hypothetical protein